MDRIVSSTHLIESLESDIAVGVIVGDLVGFVTSLVGAEVGDFDGLSVGDIASLFVGDAVGEAVGEAVGFSVGVFVGTDVGCLDGLGVCSSLGSSTLTPSLQTQHACFAVSPDSAFGYLDPKLSQLVFLAYHVQSKFGPSASNHPITSLHDDDVGLVVSLFVGASVGDVVCIIVGVVVGAPVGAVVGLSDGVVVGCGEKSSSGSPDHIPPWFK